MKTKQIQIQCAVWKQQKPSEPVSIDGIGVATFHGWKGLVVLKNGGWHTLGSRTHMNGVLLARAVTELEPLYDGAVVTTVESIPPWVPVHWRLV